MAHSMSLHVRGRLSEFAILRQFRKFIHASKLTQISTRKTQGQLYSRNNHSSTISKPVMGDYVPIAKRRAEITEVGPFAQNEFKVNGAFLPTDLHQLTVGGPGPSLLRKVAGILSQATQRRMGEEAAGQADLLQYGNPYGDPICRLELAKFLTKGYGSPVSTDHLMLTGGATQGIAFILSYFFRAGDTVFVEDPTYFINLKSFQDAHMKSVATPMDSEGIIPGALEEKLKEFKANDTQEVTMARPFRALLYLITVYHNPTTMSYSPARCRRIIELARKYDVLVVTDDVYNVLSWVPSLDDKDALGLASPRLFSYDDPRDGGHVISCGSFSKFMCPGARLGWYETAPRILDLIRKSGYLISGGNFNTFVSGIMGTALEMGLVQDHVESTRKMFAAKSRAFWNTLKDGMPDCVNITEPTGGYFIWIELPEGAVAADILKLSKEEYKVAFLPGHLASPNGNFANYIRVSFSFYDHEDIQIGAKKLIAATKQYLNK